MIYLKVVLGFLTEVIEYDPWHGDKNTQNTLWKVFTHLKFLSQYKQGIGNTIFLLMPNSSRSVSLYYAGF